MIEYIIVGVIAFLVGWKVTNYLLEKMQDNMIEGTDSLPNHTIVLFERYEDAIDMVYAYDEKDGKFLAQGTTLEEITNILLVKYPNNAFSVRPDNLKKVFGNESV
jgi:hypothetical protein